MKFRFSFGLVALWILIGQSSGYAQNHSLKQCRDDLQRKQQAEFDAFVKASVNKKKSGTIKQPPIDTRQQARQSWATCVKGLTIPDFNVATLTGEAISSNQLRGRITLINFWFMNCPPCLLELPAFNRLVDEYQDKAVTFIGFSTDKKNQLTPGFFAQHPFHFNIVSDAKALAESFGFIGYPTTFIINREGEIAEVLEGGPANEASKMEPYLKAKNVIDSLLAATK